MWFTYVTEKYYNNSSLLYFFIGTYFLLFYRLISKNQKEYTYWWIVLLLNYKILLSTMVILLDVDVNNYFNRPDFYYFWQQNFVWPWPLTHFIRRECCIECGHNTDVNSLQHFILSNESEMLKMLFYSIFFWCPICNFSVYEHYPVDECFFCN